MPINLPDTWGIKKPWKISITKGSDVTDFVIFWNTDEYLPRDIAPNLVSGDVVTYYSQKVHAKVKAILRASGYEQMEDYWWLRITEIIR